MKKTTIYKRPMGENLFEDVEAPKQRNTREENEQIKSGNAKDLWKDKPHKKCHKDTDARWTKKRGEKHYGYKLHAKADKKTKLIEKYVIFKVWASTALIS